MTKTDTLIQSGETFMWLYKPLETCKIPHNTHTYTHRRTSDTHIMCNLLFQALITCFHVETFHTHQMSAHKFRQKLKLVSEDNWLISPSNSVKTKSCGQRVKALFLLRNVVSCLKARQRCSQNSPEAIWSQAPQGVDNQI